VLAERAVKLRELERDLHIAAQKLGLYLRDEAGAPAPPTADPVPLPDPTAAEPDLDALLAEALTRRPELLSLAAYQDALRVSLRLARVSLLPKLDLKLSAEQDLPGPDDADEPLELKFGGEFSLPLALRAGRGKVDAVQAKLAALDAERAYAVDTVTVEVRTAAEALAAARDRLALVQRQVELARQVEAATRTAFALGDRTLFDLYLREQSTLKAELDEVEVLVELHVAEAALGAARGLP
jgi:outer membrane protein TolC